MLIIIPWEGKLIVYIMHIYDSFADLPLDSLSGQGDVLYGEIFSMKIRENEFCTFTFEVLYISFSFLKFFRSVEQLFSRFNFCERF